ncbi:MAG TPA: DUF3164 family protein, partial [Flavobacteriales bacterium]|nr:DUF3164 family protein [Flavobacteriales bacterium]
TTPVERKQERNAHAILEAAAKANKALTELKELVRAKHMEVVDSITKAEGVDVKQTKGNKTWYSFDRSIKVECNMHDNITFDDMLIGVAREKLNAWLNSKLTSDEEFVVELVTSAFETTNGKLDSKRIMHLLSFRSKIKAGAFQDALDTIEKSMRRTHSREYFTVGVRTEGEKYENVQLNFSAI